MNRVAAADASLLDAMKPEELKAFADDTDAVVKDLANHLDAAKELKRIKGGWLTAELNSAA